jgi:hypothetical protein
MDCFLKASWDNYISRVPYHKNYLKYTNELNLRLIMKSFVNTIQSRIIYATSYIIFGRMWLNSEWSSKSKEALNGYGNLISRAK